MPARVPAGRRLAPTESARADKAYASRKNRAYLRRRGIRCTIPDKAEQARNRKKRGSHGGRPPQFAAEDYKARHAVLIAAVPRGGVTTGFLATLTTWR
ncbi:hypothetical protein [Streptomyces parvus]|uniref:hypothetical protein n=1 Tax=Streptomyces parvus TaxID=66428 RepID=UPI003D702900